MFKSFYMTHRVPGVLKRTHLPWASQGSYIATLKLHVLVLTFSVSSVCYIAVDTLLLWLFIASSKNNPLYSNLLDSYIHNLKLHTLVFCLTCLSEQNIGKSIDFHSCQNLLARNCFSISKLPGDIYSQFKAAYTLFCCVFFLETKKVNPLILILVRTCLPEIIPLYPGLLNSHIHDLGLQILDFALPSF